MAIPVANIVIPPLANKIYSLRFTFNMPVSKKESSKSTVTIISWPTSIPRLKEKSCMTMFSSFPSILFSNELNPSPCIKPKKSA